MPEPVQQPTSQARLYRLEVVRPDGGRTIITRHLAFGQAKRSQEAIREAGILFDVQIVPETAEG